MEVKEWGKSFSLSHKQSRITASESPPAAQTHQQPPPHSPRLSLRHIRVFRRSARIWLIYLITRYIIRTDLKHTHSLSDRPQPTNGTDAVSIISGNAYVCKCQQRGCVCQCVFVLGSGRTVFFARLSDSQSWIRKRQAWYVFPWLCGGSVAFRRLSDCWRSHFSPCFCSNLHRALYPLIFRRNCTLESVSRGECFFMLWKTKTKETVYPVVKCIIVDSLRTDSTISQAFPSKFFLLDSFCHSDVLQLLHVRKSENCRFISFFPSVINTLKVTYH